MSKNRLRVDWPALLGLALAVAISFPVVAPAAPGTLAQAPLFLSAGVKPNILFVLDDSRSMDAEVLKSAGARTAHPPTVYCNPAGQGWTRNCAGLGGTLLYSDAVNLSVPPLTRDDGVLELCPGYNAMAYDPSQTYTPWVGKDVTGSPYRDRGLNEALDDPYLGTTVNLSSDNGFYFLWTDNGDGEYEPGECPRVCADDPVDGCYVDATACAGIDGCVLISSLNEEEQQNYANWYSYYRKREYVLKRAVSQLIDGSEERMGLTSLHNTGGTSTPIADMTVGDNKATLLGKLFLMDAGLGGETPLRKALDDAGRYFHAGDGLGHPYLACGRASADGCSPILPENEGGNCQQNFAILVTDGFWLEGATPWPSAGEAGFGDEDDGGSISSQWDGGSYADAPSAGSSPGCEGPIHVNTLADIAMHYYEADLAPALAPDLIPLPGVDENTQQHLVTFGVAFGVDGTLTSNPLNSRDPFPWPWVCEGQATAVDDLRHAAWNGRGSFLSARTPTGVAAGLDAAIAAMVERGVGTASSVGFSTSRLASDTLLFQAQFNPADWSGDVLAFQINADGTVQQTPTWRAADRLDNAATPGARVILTRGATDGVPFQWDSLTSSQRRDLCVSENECTDAEEVLGRLRLAFLRGDRGCEDRTIQPGCATGVDIDGNGTVDDLVLRKRGSRLGDIVNSGPILVGAPALNWPSANSTFFPTAAGQTYAAYKGGAAADRTKVVYVGANDGMLHGFRASDGMEVLAYVPSVLASSDIGSGLHYLTEPAFRAVHRFYVDRTPAISDVYAATADGAAAAWHTVAIGGLGAGGRGLYALDITDPSTFATENAADIVMWEFTNADDAELGYTVSQPLIVMMNNGQWAAIVGSGYEDTGSNEAHLFIVFLEAGLDGAWTPGADYVKIEATLGTDADPLAERNGLSSPAVADLDGNGTADRVYAGDLLGNLWAFDVSGAATETWGVAGSGTPLFRAGSSQPITTKPQISKHPSQVDIADGSPDDNQPNVMVYFGTGQYLTAADKTTNEVQAFYGIWDRGDFGLTNADLQEQTFPTGFDNQVLTDEPVAWQPVNGEARQYGWYFNLPDLGERIVVDATLRGNLAYINSMVPAGVIASPCTAGGTGFLYAVDLENGGPPDSPAYIYTSGTGLEVVDVTDVVTDAGETETQVPSRTANGGGIPTQSTFMGNVQYTGNSESPIVQERAVPKIEGLDTGRLSWQQLFRF